MTFDPSKLSITSTFKGLRVDHDNARAWKHFAWNCTLTYDGCSVDVPWKSGVAHSKKHLAGQFSRGQLGLAGDQHEGMAPTKPQAADVVESILSEADLGRESFADFCGNLGYDQDSRNALASYLECQKMAETVLALFGPGNVPSHEDLEASLPRSS